MRLKVDMFWHSGKGERGWMGHLDPVHLLRRQGRGHGLVERHALQSQSYKQASMCVRVCVRCLLEGDTRNCHDLGSSRVGVKGESSPGHRTSICSCLGRYCGALLPARCDLRIAAAGESSHEVGCSTKRQTETIVRYRSGTCTEDGC